MKTAMITLLGMLMSTMNLSAADGDTAKVKEITHLPFQLTFVSPIGSNGLLAPKTINNVSINIISGYNGGVNGVELGGFSNIIEQDVRGSQLAGFSNVVMGNTTGAQASGFSNVVLKDVRGIQASGFSNVVTGKVKGAQLAGFSNVCLDSLYGTQLAGFANYSGSHAKATQVAGFANVAMKSMAGPQISGFANIALDLIVGTQISGYANAAGDLKGSQISGFANVAKNVEGFQLAFINVSDSFSQGAPIGFFSFVNRGFRHYSFNANEMGWAEFQFRTGVDAFHNVFAVSLNPIPGAQGWAFGYGFGSKLMNTEKSDIYIDLVAYHINERKLWTNAYNGLYRLSGKYAYHPKGNKFGIWGGPSINLQQSGSTDYFGESFASKVAPYALLDDKGKSIRSKIWVGAQVGICF